MLVNATVDIDIYLREGIDNSTPLLLAVRIHSSKTRTAYLLMEHGAHPLCMDERGVIALCVAASWAKYTLVKKMLIQIRDLNDIDERARIPVPLNENGYSIFHQVKLMLDVIHISKQPKLQKIIKLMHEETTQEETV